MSLTEAVYRLLHCAEADEDTKTYARLLDEYQDMEGSKWKNLRSPDPGTADSGSEHSELSERAFAALGHRKDAKVREYALELLQNGTHTADAVSMLAKNYEVCDRDILVHAVKQVPITYRSGEWHGIFHDVQDLFYEPGKGRPKELLLYMYRNTLCSFCREYIVREMGRRRMLTRELLGEMQHDSNGEIRAYAEQKLSAME